MGLATYRTLARGFDRLPDRGFRIAEWVLDRTLPPETRADFGAGGYAIAWHSTPLAESKRVSSLESVRCR